MTTKTHTVENALPWTEPKTTVSVHFITGSSFSQTSQEKTGNFAPVTKPPQFSSHLASFKYTVKFRK